MPRRPVRIVTAASLFDGHDAAIHLIRRLLQESGAEVIHLGHNRSVEEVVRAVLQEGAQGVCVSSYQGGHMEYFKYMRDMLAREGAPWVQIFGGGGGVIVHSEKAELEAYGIAQIFHPDDGRKLGLQGMINLILEKCDFDILESAKASVIPTESKTEFPHLALGLELSRVEAGGAPRPVRIWSKTPQRNGHRPLVLGITGTGGAGKSSLIDELASRYLSLYPEKTLAIVCVDPSKKKTGGALLGDRIRMNSLSRPRVFMRSVASRGSGKEISQSLQPMLDYLKTTNVDLILAETSGIGQGNTAITEICDLSMYVMTSDFGAQSQLEKIDMLDFADLVAVNKADRRGAQDALRDVTKQVRRSKKIFDPSVPVRVFLTQASQFNDGGVNELFFALSDCLQEKQPEQNWKLTNEVRASRVATEEHVIVPPERQSYLAEIVNCVRSYKKKTEELALTASQLGALSEVRKLLKAKGEELSALQRDLEESLAGGLSVEELSSLNSFSALYDSYQKDSLQFQVRGKTIEQALVRKSLSGSRIPRVSVPKLSDWGERLRYLRMENVPGQFPFTAGVFQLKRTEEDPKRMFAGEGPPERTNARFHYLTKGESAQRLSTAFDSVTLYGFDPDPRPDIYGKVGESGVSVCTLEDMKKLYAGFDLVSPTTSVSMTINGPAPMILAFFFNSAIDQQVAKKEVELGRKLTESEHREISDWTLAQVRGTVQADILKEDQGQNTCIFSTNFALRLMGDMQQFFIDKKIRNFYSVSISGYHIAEAGANPISQLAFTLSNGFTFLEYYRARGMKVDDVAPNFSFFFSNGLDPEYSVIGRVARRIWAIAVRDLYGGNDRSQRLKYHIQTSGRSLHAQEIAFNDIRTTLQALLAVSDHCNSLHTNAYDEAITTPTQESVRRAMAIQLILAKEFGLAMSENPMQGSYFLQELTDLVEEAVLDLFLEINQRGGVLGAMETQFQRSRIQEESMHYEHLKHSGELPIIGVNTFLDPATLASDYVPPKIELARASYAEKDQQLQNCRSFASRHERDSQVALKELQAVALAGGNTFHALMKAARVCTLRQMTEALFEVGGQYRRNL